MTDARKETHLHFPEKLLKPFRKLGRKSEVKPDRDHVPEYSAVGLEMSSYRPHRASKCVSLEQIRTWSDYAVDLSPEEDGVDTSQPFVVDEALNSKISLHFGDITTLKIDAIVNSASPDLISLGAVGRDIHMAAGPELASKCSTIAKGGFCPVGQVRLTKGYELPAKYIVHAVGPRGAVEAKLRKCYRSCLDIARDTKIRTIAFPCISTQFCGYGIRQAAPVAVSTVREWLLERDNIKQVERVIFCVIEQLDRRVYERNLLRYFPIENKEAVPYEISQDPYALALYEKAIREGKETDKVIRVNIVGNYGQGKTSMKRRLVGQGLEGVASTNSIDINRYKFTKTTEGKVVCTYKQEDESRELIDRIVEVARCTLQEEIVLDDRDETFDEVDGGIFVQVENDNLFYQSSDTVDGAVNEIETEEEEINDDTKKLLGRSKEPLRTLSNQELVCFSKELKSSNSQENESKNIMDIWDFGGQFVYYATHTMFHSRQAIYLFVFDLSVDLDRIVRDEEFPGETGDKDMKYFVRFWLNSIHSFVGSEDGSLPTVILVGTHKDKLTGNVEQKCEEYFDKIRELFEGTAVINHIYPKDFAVDNMDPTDTSVDKLRAELLKIGEKLSKMTEIPAKWLPLEKALKEKRNMQIIEFQEAMQINDYNEFPLSCESQVKLFLQYHHAKGTLVYFDEERVCNHIVLDPQYLVDAFKCIITSERFCKKLPRVRDSWNKLVADGELEDGLIDAVWGGYSDQNFLNNKEILIEFLKKHHIISEAMQFDETSEEVTGLGWYIVPSLLKDHSQTNDLSEFIEGRQQTECRFVMLFENSALLQTIYCRVLAALLGKWPVVHMPTRPRKIFLFENLGVFRVNKEHAGIIELRENSIELLVVNLCPSRPINTAIADKFRRYCEVVVLHMFRLLRSSTDNVGKPYQTAVRCNHESHGACGSNFTESIAALDGAEFVPCPDFMKHEISTEKVWNDWFLRAVESVSDESKSLSERKIGKIAQAVGQNWQLLALELGLTQVQIEHVTANNDSMVMKIYDMLKTWTHRNPPSANMNVLLQAIRNTNSLSVDWDAIRNIVDESNS